LSITSISASTKNKSAKCFRCFGKTTKITQIQNQINVSYCQNFLPVETSVKGARLFSAENPDFYPCMKQTDAITAKLCKGSRWNHQSR